MEDYNEVEPRISDNYRRYPSTCCIYLCPGRMRVPWASELTYSLNDGAPWGGAKTGSLVAVHSSNRASQKNSIDWLGASVGATLGSDNVTVFPPDFVLYTETKKLCRFFHPLFLRAVDEDKNWYKEKPCGMEIEQLPLSSECWQRRYV